VSITYNKSKYKEEGRISQPIPIQYIAPLSLASFSDCGCSNREGRCFFHSLEQRSSSKHCPWQH